MRKVGQERLNKNLERRVKEKMSTIKLKGKMDFETYNEIVDSVYPTTQKRRKGLEDIYTMTSQMLRIAQGFSQVRSAADTLANQATVFNRLPINRWTHVAYSHSAREKYESGLKAALEAVGAEVELKRAPAEGNGKGFLGEAGSIVIEGGNIQFSDSSTFNMDRQSVFTTSNSQIDDSHCLRRCQQKCLKLDDQFYIIGSDL